MASHNESSQPTIFDLLGDPDANPYFKTAAEARRAKLTKFAACFAAVSALSSLGVYAAHVLENVQSEEYDLNTIGELGG